MDELICVEHLRKTYGATTAVDDVSFRVAEGEVVGLLGRNGAGKTTTIEILEGFRAPSAGTVRVLGRDPARGGRRLKNRVGIVLQSAGIDAALTVKEVVGLYASFYRPRRPVDDVLTEVDLEASAHVRVAQLSGGQRRRLDLALALSGSPTVLFLDEPTTGLDPAARHRTWDVISRLRERGVAILMTSHYLDEVQHLADRVVVLHLGRVVADGPPEHLRSEVRPMTVISFRLPVRLELPDGPWESGASGLPATTLMTERPTEAIRILASWASGQGLELEDLEMHPPSLEDVYLELTTD